MIVDSPDVSTVPSIVTSSLVSSYTIEMVEESESVSDAFCPVPTSGVNGIERMEDDPHSRRVLAPLFKNRVDTGLPLGRLNSRTSPVSKTSLRTARTDRGGARSLPMLNLPWLSAKSFFSKLSPVLMALVVTASDPYKMPGVLSFVE